METGRPHPRAPKELICDEASARVARSYTVQICGERIGVLFHQDDGRHLLRVWAWQRGVCVFEHRTDDETSFAFLTHTHLLVACVQEPDPDDRPMPVLEVFDVSGEAGDAPGKTPAPLTFHFPRFLSGLEIVHICVRSDPSPAACPTAPFGIAPTSRMFVISIWVSVHDLQPQPLIMFVPMYTFLPFLEGLVPRDVPWEEWGPSGTRISLGIFTSSIWQVPLFLCGRTQCNATRRVCYVHGMRFITRGHTVRDEGEDRYLETWLHVYEFMPLELRRDPTDAVSEARLVRASRMAVFEDPVTTALPFRRVSKLLTRTANGEDLVRKRFYPMLAEDAIVLVHVSSIVYTVSVLLIHIFLTRMESNKTIPCSRSEQSHIQYSYTSRHKPYVMLSRMLRPFRRPRTAPSPAGRPTRQPRPSAGRWAQGRSLGRSI